MDFLKLILPHFPTASIYKKDELILEPKNNIYFRLDNVVSQLDFDCKILEWCSRSCCKGLSDYWQKYMRRGVNSYFRKTWSREDYDIIYTHIGNAVNRTLTIEFILSGFNFDKLSHKIKSAIPGAAGNSSATPAQQTLCDASLNAEDGTAQS